MVSDRLNFWSFLFFFFVKVWKLWLVWPMTWKDSISWSALSILKKEYLDIDEIIDQVFQDILNYSPKEDGSYSDLRGFISRIASLLRNGEFLFLQLLWGWFGCSLANKFLNNLKGEMILLTGRRMPTLYSILQLTSEAIKRQLIKGGVFFGSTLDISTCRDSSF